MSWTDIPTILVQIGAKPFASTIRALRDNIPALANGDPGAPRVSPKAWGQTPLAASAVGTVTLAGFSGYGGADVDVHFSNNVASSGSLTLALSDDGATFYSAAAISQVASNSDGGVSLFVDFETGAIKSAWHGAGGAGLQTVSAGVPPGSVSHIRIVAAGTTTIAVLARVNAGTVA